MGYELRELGMFISLLNDNGRCWPRVFAAWLNMEINGCSDGLSRFVITPHPLGDIPCDLDYHGPDARRYAQAIRQRIYARLQKHEIGAYHRFLRDFQAYQNALADNYRFKSMPWWYKLTHIPQKLRLVNNLMRKNKFYGFDDLAAVAADLFVLQQLGTVDDFMTLLLLRG